MSSRDLIELINAAARSDFQTLRDAYFLKLEVCTFAVVVGVLIEEGEYFTSWPRVRRVLPLRVLLPVHRFDAWMRRLSKVGWILIVLGVGGEFWYEARVSRADGWIQEFNSILSRKQQADLIVLGDITATARSDAKLASDASTKAIEGASSAVKLSTDAESHLKGALSKAEEVATLAKGYEQGIQDAKRDASEAKALLAEARQLALEARSGVARIQTPRSLQNTHSMSLRLAEFKGTEYTFSEVCPDKECNDLLKSIDSLLMAADWKRVKPPTGFPAINVYGSNQDLAVPESLIPGIRVAIESPTPFPGDLVLGKSPRYVQASVALRDELVSNLLPAAIPEDAPLVNRDKEGGSQTIRIAVGRKP